MRHARRDLTNTKQRLHQQRSQNRPRKWLIAGIMTMKKQRINPGGLILKDQLISINRVTKVVKGGKNMSFAALVVIGDEAGHVGFGTGKAKEVPNAIKKAVEAAKNSLIRVPLIDGTLPHEMI